jgi:large subunit ribosomal protein L30
MSQNNSSKTNSLEIIQKRSLIGRPKKQEGTIKALGLGRIGKKVIHADTPDIRGMINKVIHLIEVKEIKSGDKA